MIFYISKNLGKVLFYKGLCFWHGLGLLESQMRTKQYKIYVLFGLLSLLCIKTQAQKVWSLQECIAYALEHNLELKSLNYNVETNKEVYKQSYRELLPRINANSNYRIRYGRSIDDQNRVTFNDNFSNFYSINASIDVFQGLKKWNRIAASKFVYKAVKEDVLQQKFLLAFNTMNAYYDVLFYRGLVENSKKQQEISLANYQFVQKQVDLGLKAGVDLYEAEATRMNDQLTLVRSQNLLKEAALRLQQTMNIEVAENFKIEQSHNSEVLLADEKVKLDSVYGTSVAFLPSIQSRKYSLEASRKNLKVVKGDLYPSLTLTSGISTSVFETNRNENDEMIPFKEQLDNNLSEFVSLNLSVPIFNKWTNRSRIKRQKIAVKQAENQLALEEQALYKMIQDVIQKYKTASASYKLTEKNVALRALTFEIAQKKYRRGLLSLIELNQAKNLYAQAQNEKLQTQLDLEIQSKTLAFYKGVKVFSLIQE